MSLLQFDGFDSEGSIWARYGASVPYSQWGGPQTEIIRDTGTYRPGGSIASYRLYKNYWAGQCYIYKDFDITTDTLITGFGQRMSSFGSGELYEFVELKDGNSTGWCSLGVNSSGKLYIRFGSNYVYGTSTVSTNTQYYLQFKQKSNRNNSYAIVTLNNAIEIAVYNQPICTYNNRVTQAFYRCGGSTTGPSYYLQFDDIYIVNDDGVYPSDFLGSLIVRSEFPDGTGDVMDFTNYGSSNAWQNIDDPTQDGNDYVYSNVSNQKALFTFNDLTSSNEVLSIFVWEGSTRSELGMGTSKYRLVIRNAADVEYEYPTDRLCYDVNHRMYGYMFNNNPITDNTWTLADINDLQLGWKVTQVF